MIVESDCVGTWGECGVGVGIGGRGAVVALGEAVFEEEGECFVDGGAVWG